MLGLGLGLGLGKGRVGVGGWGVRVTWTEPLASAIPDKAKRYRQ